MKDTTINKSELKDSQLSIFVELNGKVHMVGMDKEKLEAISLLIKQSIELIIPTGKSQQELRDFAGYKDFKRGEQDK